MRHIAIIAILTLLIVAVTAKQEREGTSRTSVAPYRRLVCIGDLHGDFNHTLIILRAAKLINRHGQWIAGHDVVVQVGDILDRGPESRHIIDLIRNLTVQATNAGGKFVTLLGNHELMNLQGILSYVSNDDYELFGGRALRYAAFKQGQEYGDWLRSLPIVYYNRPFQTVFVHAGILPEMASMGIEGINSKGRAAIQDGDWHHPILGTRGPVWSRTLVHDATRGLCELLKTSLKLLGAKRMVVGHTPQRSGQVGEYCDSRLIVVDTMISRWMDPKGSGNVKALEMTLEGPKAGVVLQEIEARVPRPREQEGKLRAPKTLMEALDANTLHEMMDILREYQAKKPYVIQEPPVPEYDPEIPQQEEHSDGNESSEPPPEESAPLRKPQEMDAPSATSDDGDAGHTQNDRPSEQEPSEEQEMSIGQKPEPEPNPENEAEI